MTEIDYDQQWMEVAEMLRFADVLPEDEAFLVIREFAGRMDPDTANPVFCWLMAHIYQRFIAKE